MFSSYDSKGSNSVKNSQVKIRNNLDQLDIRKSSSTANIQNPNQNFVSKRGSI